MKNPTKTILSLTTVLAISAFSFLQYNWNIDPNYSIKFSTKKAEGIIKGSKGSIVFDPNYLENAKMAVSVEVNSLETGNAMKDKHAKSESWLDA